MKSTQLVCSRNKMEKTTHNSAQNFIAKFPLSFKLFLLFSFCASGENSVAKPQRVLQANRWRQLRARSLINSLKICRKNWCLSGKNWNYFFVKPCKRDLLKMYFQSEDAKRLAKVIRKKWESQSFFYCNYLNTNFFYKFLDWDFETLRLSVR